MSIWTVGAVIALEARWLFRQRHPDETLARQCRSNAPRSGAVPL